MKNESNTENAVPSEGVSRIEQKLRSKLASKDFYEAHQLYRTLHFRYSAQKKYEELKSLLYDGASEFLRSNQSTSGADLAMLYIDVLTKSLSPINETVLDKVELLYSLIPINNENINRETFVHAAIKWTTTVYPNFNRGHPRLHRKFALVLWHEKNYLLARQHFLLSDDGEACASFLIEYHLIGGYPNEADLFVVQAVFQFLCYKNISTATSVFQEYTTKHPKISNLDGPPYVLPLLNFVWLLLLCIDTGKVSFYTILVEKYQPCLQRDPSYANYLDKIGQLFFGLPPPVSNKKAGIFDSLLKNFLSDDAEDDSNDNLFSDAPSSSSSAATLADRVSSGVNPNVARPDNLANGEVIVDDTLD